MKYRKLGRYGVRVSEVSLGNWLTQGRTVDEAATEKLVRHAVDLGINFFDTANNYQNGKAEIALGKAIKSLPRESLFLATKCFFPVGEGPNDRGLSRKHIFESFHRSLKRMQVDYVDLMQFHRYDAETPLDETVRAIDDLVRQGKVLYWGVSEWSAAEIAMGVATAERLGAHPPVSNQPQYSLLWPKIEHEILPLCERFGMGQVVYSPLAQGVLTGKYLPGQAPAEGTRMADPTSRQWMGGLISEDVLVRVQRLKEYVDGLGLPLPAFSLAWCLRQPGVSSVIVGASRADQLDANVAAVDLEVPEGAFAKAEAILAGTE